MPPEDSTGQTPHRRAVQCRERRAGAGHGAPVGGDGCKGVPRRALEAEDAVCVWENRLEPEDQRTRISIRITYSDSGEACDEEFYEYWYTLDQIKAICRAHGLEIVDVRDGESFGDCTETSQRWLITAVKQYTQEEK